MVKLYRRKNNGSMSLSFILIGVLLFLAHFTQAQKAMENLGRGVVAVRTSASQVMVGWRMLGTDPSTISFNVYRGATKLNASPITTITSYIDNITTDDTYSVKPVIGGVEQAGSPAVGVWAQNYLTVPLQTLAGHTPNDASVGDLDGDGEYEIILKQEMIPMDPSTPGTTGQTKLEAYKLNGTLLWRIDLGINIREGAHYTPFIVYDLNSDGRAEIVSRTAEGTIDGTGVQIGDVNADGISDYRGTDGRILTGPEFFSVFDGLTGKELARANYIPRGNICDWGADCYGNRVDRFLMGVGYFDGKKPSLLICRGYYGKSVLQAWDWRDGALTTRWTFDTTNPTWSAYAGNGNHNLSISDVDNDGKDEIIYGAMAVNDDGTGLHNTGLGHGDALHVSDLDPTRPGMEILDIREWNNPLHGIHMRDASTGALLWSKPCTAVGGEGPGRSLSLDVDPRYAGFESWCAGGGIPGMFDAKGNLISSTTPTVNFGIYWDGDLLSEVLDGNKLDKWNHLTGTSTRMLSAYNVAGAAENNDTKKNACLTGDILGDWREEIIYRHWNNQSLIIFTTTIPTTYRFYTLMHDPHYRASIAWQNVGYNQPPHLGFFMGDGMAAAPTPNIVLVRGNANLANGNYIIKPVHSNLCIEGATNATQQSCNATLTSQKWGFTKVGDNYEIKNLSTGTYLYYANTNNGNALTFTTGTTNRQFAIQNAGNNQFYIVPPGTTNKAIDMQGNDNQLGRKMVTYNFGGGPNQRYTFTATSATRTLAEAFEEDKVIQQTEEVSAAPNPSNGAFKVAAKGIFTYVIHDSFKNAHEKGTGKDEAIVGANLKPGLYIMKVQTQKGSKLIKLIKQ